MWQTVTKEEFESFLTNYGNPLCSDVAMFCEPPMRRYCDFSDSNTSENMVARIWLNKGYNMPNEYQIRNLGLSDD